MTRSRVLLDSVVVAAPDQVSAELDGEAVVLSLGTGLYHGLNEVGARVWELVSEPRTVESITETIRSEYEVERERCQVDVLALLEDLLDQRLIEVHPRT